MNELHYVYRIVCFHTGKCYVGKTVDVKKRRQTHFRTLKKNTHHNKHLQNAYNKYGEKSLYFEVIENSIKEESIKEREKYWIAHFDSFNNGFNLTPGGDEPSISICNPCVWNKIQYSSVSSAARALGINSSSLIERLDRGYGCDDDVQSRETPVTYNGIDYPSILEAAISIGISYSAMKSRIYSNVLNDADLVGSLATSKRCVWNDVEYISVSEAARSLGISGGAMANRLRNGYKCDADLVGKSSVIYNGAVHKSIRDAADATGINYSTMRSRIQNGVECDDDIGISSLIAPTVIHVNKTTYSSLSQACKSLGISRYKLKQLVELEKKSPDEGHNGRKRTQS